ncbi:MAG: hypothetical protein Q9227_001385 [Pyrenula ochraceoflavens]
MKSNESIGPAAKGVVATAKQSWRDLFRWKQRTIVIGANGDRNTEWQSPEPLRNPFHLFALLSVQQWLYFLVGFAAWTADAFDFHALSIQTVKLAAHFDTSKTNVTTAITLTLLLRSSGAAIFGLAGDRFGRRWPMVLNMILLGILQVATIYSRTFTQFLAVRSLFGVFMGGIYGNAIAMVLENCPVNARGLISGILQQGYSFGYVLAACTNLAVGGSVESWRTVFWVATGLSTSVGLFRAFLPESEHFRKARLLRKHNKAAQSTDVRGSFWLDLREMVIAEWKMMIYCIILMSWFGYYCHCSQDPYTTFLLAEKQLENGAASRASIFMKVGACIGGSILGYLSQWLGRRRTIILAALMSAALIPAWILPQGERSLSASGFFMQFFVQGAFGVIPIHLNELAPPAFRSSFPGVTYQIGNMISSPSAQIINAIAESHFKKGKDGKNVEAYGPTMGIAMAIVAFGIVVTAALGPEMRGRRFEDAKPAGEEGVIGQEESEALEKGEGTKLTHTQQEKKGEADVDVGDTRTRVEK